MFLLNGDIKQKRILIEILQGIMNKKQIDVLQPYINKYFRGNGFTLDLIINPQLKDYGQIHRKASILTKQILKKYKNIFLTKYRIVDKFTDSITSNTTLDITNKCRNDMNVYERPSMNITINNNKNKNKKSEKQVKITESKNKNSVYVTYNTTINTKYKTGKYHYTLVRLRLAIGKATKSSGIIIDVSIPFKDDYKIEKYYNDIKKSIQTIGGYKIPSLEYQVKYLKLRIDDTKQSSVNDYKNSTLHFNYIMEYIIAKSLYNLIMKNNIYIPPASLKETLSKEQKEIIERFIFDVKSTANI